MTRRELTDRLLTDIRSLDLPPVSLMEVCGTHTMAIARYGIKRLLPPQVKLLSGPGCPVCVTPAEAIEPQHIVGRLWFQPANCIHCGLCVYNTTDAFTFRGRGIGMEVVIAPESKKNVEEEIAELCPTGALYVEKVKK